VQIHWLGTVLALYNEPAVSDVSKLKRYNVWLTVWPDGTNSWCPTPLHKPTLSWFFDIHMFRDGWTWRFPLHAPPLTLKVMLKTPNFFINNNSVQPHHSLWYVAKHQSQIPSSSANVHKLSSSSNFSTKSIIRSLDIQFFCNCSNSKTRIIPHYDSHFFDFSIQFWRC
jgi:hypothetical protein